MLNVTPSIVTCLGSNAREFWLVKRRLIRNFSVRYGKWLGTMIKNENNLSSLFHLQCQCDEERDCNYYTFNAQVKLCSLFATF